MTRCRRFLIIALVVVLSAVCPARAADSGDATATLAQCHYYWNLITDLEAGSPTLLRDEAVSVTTRLHDSIMPSPRKGIPHAEALALARGLFDRMRGDYATISVEWDDAAAKVTGPSGPLTFTSGLLRHVIVEVANLTSSPLDLGIGAGPGSAPIALAVPPGQKRCAALPVALTVAEPTTTFFMQLAPTRGAGAPRTVSLPVNIVAPAVVRGRLLDKDTGTSTPGRVWAAGGDGILRHGKAYAEDQTLSRKAFLYHPRRFKDSRQPFFYSNGEFEVLLPPGRAVLRLERGFEHPIVEHQLDLEAGKTHEVALESGRFLDMRKLGWISGDTHIHWSKNWWSEDEDIELLPIIQRAEDLRVANNLTLLHRNADSAFISPNQAPMGPIARFCGPDYHIQMAEEYRNGNLYGHLCFLNIKHLILPISTGQEAGPDSFDYPLNRTAIENCREQGGISTEAHNLGPFNCSEVPSNVVAGLSDSLDQLDAEHYYRFLDCGFRIPLSNGSDHPARLIGSARVYVKCDDGFTYANWIEGIRKRQTFTSSGPLLFLTVDGKEIGSVLDVAKGTPLVIRARVASRRPVGTFQVLANGRVVKEARLEASEGELEVTLPAAEPMWLVARCSRTDEFNALYEPDVAHTSATYVDIDGMPRFDPAAARFWIGALNTFRNRVAKMGSFLNARQREEALANVDASIKLYEELIVKFAESPGAAQ